MYICFSCIYLYVIKINGLEDITFGTLLVYVCVIYWKYITLLLLLACNLLTANDIILSSGWNPIYKKYDILFFTFLY